MSSGFLAIVHFVLADLVYQLPNGMPTHRYVLEARSNVQLLTGGALCQARVTVAEPLPLLKGRIRAPVTCATPADATPPATPKKDREHGRDREGEDAPELTHVVALKGQVLTWEVGLLNAGTPVPWQCLTPWLLLSDVPTGAHHSDCKCACRRSLAKSGYWACSGPSSAQSAAHSSLQGMAEVAVCQEWPCSRNTPLSRDDAEVCTSQL